MVDVIHSFYREETTGRTIDITTVEGEVALKRLLLCYDDPATSGYTPLPWSPPLAEPKGDEWFDWRELIVSDTETNGLLDLPNEVFVHHCAWTFDPNTGIYRGYRPHEFAEYVRTLDDKVLVFHNGIGYDYQAIDKLCTKYGVEPPRYKQRVDSLVLVKMLWSLDDLLPKDAKLWHAGKMPGEQMKRQGIEAWGYRLGFMKGDYSKEMKAKGLDPWAHFNEAMYSYNHQDVVVNWQLLLAIFRRLNWFQKPTYRTLADGTEEEVVNKSFRTSALAVEVEHEMQTICLEMEHYGAGFDRDKAVQLAGTLLAMRSTIEERVASAFKPWWQPKGDIQKGTIIPKTRTVSLTYLPDVTVERYGKTGKRLADYVGPPKAEYPEGNAHVPVVYTEFNLNNRHHLAARLQAVYGWKPREFGGAKGTDPVIDEATIKAIPDSVLGPELKQAILDYYTINKTYATLAEGNKAWLKLYDEKTGTIHGRVDPLGTVTHRAAHKDPNLGNIPSVELDEEKDASGKVISKTAITGLTGGFGHECRELFVPRSPFDTEVGIDVYALELFMLGHYLQPYDEGEFGIRVSTPGLDIHSENAKLIGLPRKDTKTTSYKTLYGSGALAIGVDVWKPEDDIAEWANAKGVKNWINWQQREQGDLFKMPSLQDRAYYGKGSMAKNALLNGITGLKDFIRDVKEKADKRGFIIGIDGRRLSVRKAFAALNALLQASGSICCKVWIITLSRMLEAKGLKRNVDWGYQEWVHDEVQIGTKKKHAKIVAETAHEAIIETSRILKLRFALQVEAKIGGDWAECH